MREFGIESLSSSQVSRATKLLDEELAAWRDRPLGEINYLTLDARYEKMRHGGIVRDVAVLSAIGMPGVAAMEDIGGLMAKVRGYSTFTDSNDPYGEHDFGSFEHEGQLVFWKFDYYDLDMNLHSPDAIDPAVTRRVLTIMLAQEY
jgi:hypothetical protein